MARTLAARRPQIDEVADAPQDVRVTRHERYAVDVGGRSDRRIDHTTARLAVPRGDSRRQAAPLPRDRRVDRQRLEGRVDDAQAPDAFIQNSVGTRFEFTASAPAL
jgi:hypothetical protein